MPINYFDGVRGVPGALISLTDTAGSTKRAVVPAMTIVDQAGAALGTTPNPLVTSGPTGTSSNQVQGTSAPGVTDDASNPLKVGGVTPSGTGALTPLPTNGDRINFLSDRFGNQRSLLATVNLTPAAAALAGYSINAQRGLDTPAAMVPLAVLDGWWTGAQAIPAMGDTNGGYMVSKGSGSINTAQVSVATTATLIAAARTARGSIKITNVTGLQQIYIGNAGVTAATGDLLPAAIGASITLPFNGAVYGIAVTAAQTVSFLEVF